MERGAMPLNHPSLYISGRIGQENEFSDILETKKAFLCYRNKYNIYSIWFNSKI